jgi:hypothetical protein
VIRHCGHRCSHCQTHTVPLSVLLQLSGDAHVDTNINVSHDRLKSIAIGADNRNLPQDEWHAVPEQKFENCLAVNIRNEPAQRRTGDSDVFFSAGDIYFVAVFKKRNRVFTSNLPAVSDVSHG